MGRIQSARNANHQALGPCVGQALEQAVDLDVVSLETTLVAFTRIAGDIRKAANVALQRNLAFGNLKFESNPAHGINTVPALADGIVKTGQAHAILKQTFEVNVRGNHLLAVSEPFGL